MASNISAWPRSPERCANTQRCNTAGCSLLATSTALLVSALQDLAGEAHIRFHVPNRFTESHGIRVPVLHRSDNGEELDWPFSVDAVAAFLQP